MDCERCSAELLDGGNFCSNCGEPCPNEAASRIDQTGPCRDCAQEVQVEAGFCWNCGARSPHLAPAVTGNTVVQKAPPDPQGPRPDDDLDDLKGEENGRSVGPPDSSGSRTMQRGSGSVPLAPAEPTSPKSVRSGFRPSATEPAIEATPPNAAPDDPAKLPRRVASMIAEELGEEPSTDLTTPPAQEVAEDGSEPLSLEPEVDAALAQVKKSAEPTNVSEEVAELQFLMLRGFHSEAEAAYRLLIAAHPGHPDLLALGEELKASKAAVSVSSDALDSQPVAPAAKASPAVTEPSAADNPAEVDAAAAPPAATNKETSAAQDGLRDITVVTAAADTSESKDDGGSTPVETPTSPTFIEGTSPPTGGFAVTSAVPRVVEPNMTPRLGIQTPERPHMPSPDSSRTDPRMPLLDIDTTAVSKPAGVRVVMLGTRGEAVWERLLGAGEMLEVGRDSGEPWGEDLHIEPCHARLFVIPGGGLRIEPMGRSAVYRQVDERLAVRDGDEFRVGESLLRYSAQDSAWGAVTCYPMSGTTCNTVPIGGSGLIVGRENADIELTEDTFVSTAHCRFSCRDERLFIEDMGSANGTYSRLRPGEAVPYGALLLLGQTQFKVCRPTQ